MKREKNNFELAVLKAMKSKGYEWQSLADDVGIADGCNLNKAVIKRTTLDCTLIKLCNKLDLNIAEMYLLKLERYEN